jgi:hypothetical protein
MAHRCAAQPHAYPLLYPRVPGCEFSGLTDAHRALQDSTLPLSDGHDPIGGDVVDFVHAAAWPSNFDRGTLSLA